VVLVFELTIEPTWHVTTKLIVKVRMNELTTRFGVLATTVSGSVSGDEVSSKEGS